MSFPKELLRPKDSALCLFCAAFGGAQVEAFLRDAGLREVTCIDTDEAKVDLMRPEYPRAWTFRCQDAFEFIFKAAGYVDESATRGVDWDVVTADPWGGDCEEKLIGLYPSLLRLAKRVLVVSVTEPARAAAERKLAATGVKSWRVIRRSDYRGGTFFLVIEKEVARA